MRRLRLALPGTLILALLSGLGGAALAESEGSEAEEFPTGTFVAEEDGLTVEFRADGTCQRSGVACTYGARDDLFSEMTFEEPSGEQGPATYYWDFDGEHLTFESWGEDRRPSREDAYTDHSYRLTVPDEAAAPATESDFPTGMFVPADGSENSRLRLGENGSFSTDIGATGKYVVNGDLFTVMTQNSNIGGKVPGTYRWRWAGEQLAFSVWGDDPDPLRKSFLGKVYVRVPSVLGETRRLLLSHPQLDDWVTVEIAKRDDGSYAVDATIDEEPLGEGVGDTPQEAVRAALEALGEPYASDMAEDVKG